MATDHKKFISFKRREGELYVKVTDGNFSKVYENTVGLNDKNGLKRMMIDLKNKGIDLFFIEKKIMEELW